MALVYTHSMSFNEIISIVTVGGLIYIGRKLQVLDDLKVTVDKIKINLKVIGDYMIRKNSDFDSSELQTFSPIHLTEKGDAFIKETGFDTVFSEHKEDFFGCIESENPKLKYDVETASIKSISMLSEKEYMNFLKILFYNEPARKMENTAPILGIYIRDKFLEEHPEITQ